MAWRTSSLALAAGSAVLPDDCMTPAAHPDCMKCHDNGNQREFVRRLWITHCNGNVRVEVEIAERS
jgi:hypothetical protein